MEQLVSSISLIKFFFIISLVILCSSCDDTIEPILECVECSEYSYLQSYGDTIILVTLNDNTYCIGDSAWTDTNNNFWTTIDLDLLELMSESGYCQAIQDSIH